MPRSPPPRRHGDLICFFLLRQQARNAAVVSRGMMTRAQFQAGDLAARWSPAAGSVGVGGDVDDAQREIQSHGVVPLGPGEPMSGTSHSASRANAPTRSTNASGQEAFHPARGRGGSRAAPPQPIRAVTGAVHGPGAHDTLDAPTGSNSRWARLLPVSPTHSLPARQTQRRAILRGPPRKRNSPPGLGIVDGGPSRSWCPGRSPRCRSRPVPPRREPGRPRLACSLKNAAIWPPGRPARTRATAARSAPARASASRATHRR